MRSTALVMSDSARAATMIGLAYGVFGTLWVLISDQLVAAISLDPEWRQAAQHYKGVFYVFLTAIGLAFLVRAIFVKLVAAQGDVAESELRLQDLFEGNPLPMWVYEKDSLKFLKVNDAAVAKYGYSRAEFLAMTAIQIRPEEDIEAFVDAVSSSELGYRAPGVFRHRTKSGDLLYARITEHSLMLEDRVVMMVMAEDVTEEIRMHRALEREQEKFRQLHNSLGEVLWMGTADGRSILYVSAAFAQIYGRDPAQLLERPALWRESVHPDDRALAAGIDSPPDVGQGVRTYRILRPDGEIRWIEDRRRVIRDEEGRAVLIGGIAEDVTARKERDEAREQLNGELERLVAERTADLEQANIELEAFSRTAAHDLKSPLNGIAGLAYLLGQQCQTKLDDRGLGLIKQIERSALNMAELIDDLLRLSRAGSVELHKKAVDLAPLARGIVDELRLGEPLRQVEVVLPESMPAFCDEGLMRSVLQNVIGNAWKFTGRRERARIEVAVSAKDSKTSISVKDNGSGFDTSSLAGMFRPFQRFHSQSQFAGTGLGLVTCQRIAHRHGGEVSVSSAPDVGTTVSIALPDDGQEGACRHPAHVHRRHHPQWNQRIHPLSAAPVQGRLLSDV